MADTHTLGGRKFVEIGGSSIEQDYYFQGLIKGAGIDELERGADEEAGDFAGRMLDALVANQAVLRMLGVLLIPADAVPSKHRGDPGEVWTPDMAEETAGFLGRLRRDDDKAKVRSLVLTLLLDFLNAGIDSLTPTQTSSPSPVPAKIDQTGSRSATAAGPG